MRLKTTFFFILLIAILLVCGPAMAKSGNLYSGSVKLVDLGKKSGGDTMNTVKITDLRTGASTMAKGVWLRLGKSYVGASTVWGMVNKVCKNDYHKKVLADNGINHPRGLHVGHEIFIRDYYLEPEFRFPLEGLLQAQTELARLKAGNGDSHEIAQIEQQIGGVEKALKVNIRDLTEQLTTKARENEELTAEVAGLKEMVAEKSNAIESLEGQIAQLQSAGDSDNADLVADLREENAKLRSSLDKAEIRIAELTGEVEQTNKALVTERAETAELETTHKVLVVDHRELSANYEAVLLQLEKIRLMASSVTDRGDLAMLAERKKGLERRLERLASK